MNTLTSISFSLLISVISAQRVTIPGTSYPFTSCTCGWWMGGDLQFGSYAQCPSGSNCLHLYYNSMGYEDFDCSGYQSLRVGYRLRTQSNAVTFQFHCIVDGQDQSWDDTSHSSATYQYHSYTNTNDCRAVRLWLMMEGNGEAYINDLWIEGIPNTTPQSSATDEPSTSPTNLPSKQPSSVPSKSQSNVPSKQPSKEPSNSQTKVPSTEPSHPTPKPTVFGERMVDDMESTQMSNTIERDAGSGSSDNNIKEIVVIICLCIIVFLILWLLFKLKTKRTHMSSVQAKIADDLDPGGEAQNVITTINVNENEIALQLGEGEFEVVDDADGVTQGEVQEIESNDNPEEIDAMEGIQPEIMELEPKVTKQTPE